MKNLKGAKVLEAAMQKTVHGGGREPISVLNCSAGYCQHISGWCTIGPCYP